jgi:serine/threonine protein kinase
VPDLKNQIEILFGYSENPNLITQAMVRPILAELFPSLDYLGVLGIGAEACVLKCQEVGTPYFCAVKIAAPRFLKKEFVRERGLFGGNRIEVTNVPRERFLNGVTIQKMAANLAGESQDFPVVIPGKILLKEEPWLAYRMEFVDGMPLLRFFQERKNFRESMGLYANLLLGVEALHDAGIIHRDLKPENIMVTGNSLKKTKIAIVDWTQTKLLGIDSKTLPGTAMGTLPYSSERLTIEASAGDASPEDDVVCLAVMLFEFCTFKKVPKPKGDLLHDREARQEYLGLLKNSIHPYLYETFELGCMANEESRFKKVRPLLDSFRSALAKAGFFQLAEEGWELNLAKMQGEIFQLKEKIKKIEGFLEAVIKELQNL